jgi:uncharacterized protein
MRDITADAIDRIAEGSAVLGAGGGGDPFQVVLVLHRLIRLGARLRVVEPGELDDEATGPILAGMGAPTVGVERLPASGRMGALVAALGQVTGRQPAFLAIGEIGGGNALEPFVGAAETGLPVVDADPMGRALPELQMNTYMIDGLLPRPLLLEDGKQVTATLYDLPDALTAERYARALTWAMGGSAGLALTVLSGRQVREHGIAGTLSLAEALGSAMAGARRAHRPTVEGIAAVVPSMRCLFEGKVVDVERRTAAGFARGVITLEGLGPNRGERLLVDFQNEYLIARRPGGAAGGEVLLTVPDLLVLVEQESGRALGSEAVRYGLRVRVVGLPAAREMKTPRALAVVGPRVFGYDVDFRPLEGDLIPRPAGVA